MEWGEVMEEIEEEKEKKEEEEEKEEKKHLYPQGHQPQAVVRTCRWDDVLRLPRITH